MNTLDRFMAKVQKTDTCWLWTASLLNSGYGQFRYNGTMALAHRVSYELHIGPIPEGHVIDHAKERGCKHRHCVNPAHLEAVTYSVNNSRSHKNAGKTHCKRGHEFTPENTYVDPRGRRTCRMCNSPQGRAARHAER